MAIFLLIVGLVLLTLGGDWLVRGASKLAVIMGISPLVVGLTIVAMGTSSPEMAVSIKAGCAGQDDIAVGNVVGSNIFNVLFILGVSALVAPLVVSTRLVWLEVPIMVGTSVLAYLLCLDGRVSLIDGLILSALLVGYMWLAVFLAGREKSAAALAAATAAEAAEAAGEAPAEKPEEKSKVKAVLLCIGLCLIGLVVLILGTNLFVDGAVKIARQLGVSELVIALTIVAAGTSLPEVFTSVLATLKGERDIAVGNVVGSNIFNVLAIMGISAVVTPGGLAVSEHVLAADLPIMVAVAIACLPVFFTGHTIARWEGVVFLAYYIAYTTYLIIKPMDDAQDYLPLFRMAMFYVFIPLTVLTLFIGVWRGFRNPKGNMAEPAS